MTMEEYISVNEYITHVSAGLALGICIGAATTALLFLVAAEFLI